MENDGFVISGMSARFPQADSLAELKEKLYAGVDLITDDEARWPRGLLGAPARMGTIRDLSRFDAQFFSVPPRQAEAMDPQLRLLLETTHEAIVDSGNDPATLRGRNIGVFVGSVALCDTFSPLNGDSNRVDGYAVTCSMPSMLSNRVSFCFDFRGPSLTIDTASSSSMAALNLAMQSLRSGECDAAVVGGANVLLNPCTTHNLVKLNMLSPDGRCKGFDTAANGYVRSEVVGAVFLQRASEARRIYAKIVHVKCNADGYKIEGPTYPSGKVHEQLLRELCAEAKVDAREVIYVEAHGAGTQAGDPQECGAFKAVFCPPGRKKPLMVGSVKTNMGHCEGASGIASMAKVILAMETGLIAGNLHFNTPNPKIPALHDGSLKIVTEATPFQGGMVGIQSSGVGGTNVHAILESYTGPHVDTLPRQKPELPRLVLMAGRSRDSLEATLDRLAADGPYPDSAYALLNRVGQPSVKQFPCRGYILVNAEDSSRKDVLKAVDQAPSEKRPLWFVFAGAGSQWKGMARQMMHFDLFARSIRKCHDVAQQFGIDLISLITSQEACCSTVGSMFVSIVAIQVALVDTLRAMGIHPDGIVGHSLGEIGCGYADGALSAEKAILCAYWRGHCTEQGDMPEGAMAVVGLSWEEVQKRRSDGVQAACDNAKDSVTVSGPAKAVSKFVDELTAEGVFARKVESMNVAFHSSLISSAGPKMRQMLQKVLPEPKPRSDRWISSSVPESRWTEPIAQHCSADYFVNNFLSPVLFREAMQHLPPDAIIVEIAPHCLLQPNIRRSMGPSSSYVGLMKRGADNLSFFLGSLGKLHNLGVQMDLSPLYPSVPWPVPRGTPSIGHLVAWDHSQSWKVVGWKEFLSSGQASDKGSASEEFVGIDMGANGTDRYLADHQVDGQIVVPLGSYLVLVWKSLAKRCNKPFDKMPVVFENVTLHRITTLPPNGSVQFSLSIAPTSGDFQLCQGGSVVLSGSVRVAAEGISVADKDLPDATSETVVYELDTEDVYREFALRGHEYGPAFRGVIKACIKKPLGKLRWDDNWVTFIGSMLQFSTLTSSLRNLFAPYQLQFCLLDPEAHAQIVLKAQECGVDVVYSRRRNTCRAGGVLLRGLKTRIINRCAERHMAMLEECYFVPYMDDEAATAAREAQVQEYIGACCSVAKQLHMSWGTNGAQSSGILKDHHEVPQPVIESYLEKPAANHGLLQALAAISKEQKCAGSSLHGSIQSVLAVHKQNIENDLLNTALFKEDSLGHLLDIAADNTNTRKIRVLELAFQDSLFAPSIINLLSRANTGLRIEYTVVHDSPDRLAPEHIPNGIKTVAWGAFSASSGKVAEVDLVAVREKTLSSKCLEALAEEIHKLCKVNGFLLVAQRTVLTPAEAFLCAQGKTEFYVHSISKVETVFTGQGFRLIGLKSNNTSALLLFRKCPVQAANVEVIHVNSVGSGQIEKLKNKVLEYERKPAGENLWLLGTGTSDVVGLTKCLWHEAGRDRIRCMLDASIEEPHKGVDFRSSNPAYKEVLERDLVTNVYCDGQWGSYRHVAAKSCGAPTKDTEFAVLGLRSSGDLDSLEWFESPLSYSLPQRSEAGGDRILCSVYCAAVNRHDVAFAMGNTTVCSPGHTGTAEYHLGQEFSGRDPSGRRVMGVVPSHSIATMVAADPLLLWEVPESWTLQEASTVPLAYSTAYYALFVTGNTRPGDTVLVHSGSDFVGQAAISICLSVGCNVFATVGSSQESQFLKSHFPQMEQWQFVNSRDIFLLDTILEHTGGKGVDLVLNCLGGCLPWSGRHRDALTCSSSVSMSPKIINVVGHFDALRGDDAMALPHIRRVAELIRDGIGSGAVRPLDAAVFTPEQAAEAFRMVESEKDARKVLIQVRQEESEHNASPYPPFSIQAVCRTYFYAHKTHIIAGGLCVFGMELADWMVARGCRKLILISRSGVRTGHQQLYLHRWDKVGATVHVSNADISTGEGTREVIEEAAVMGPVGSIFYLAEVPPEAHLNEQGVRSPEAHCERKVSSSTHLDQLSRQLCPQLDHFVVFSFACSSSGCAAHDGYAGSAVERICERRAADGLPGLAVQWDTNCDISSASDAIGSDMPFGGCAPQRICSCLDVVERLLNQQRPVVSSVVKTAAESSKMENDKDEHELVRAVAKILGFEDPSKMDPATSLADLGMDSVMGVEVLHAIERHCGLALSMQKVRLLSLNALLVMGVHRGKNEVA